MPNAKRPAGPSRPTDERKQAVTEREELDELARGDDAAADLGLGMPSADDAGRAARHAERDAHGDSDDVAQRGGDRGRNS